MSVFQTQHAISNLRFRKGTVKKEYDYDSLRPPFQLRKGALYVLNMVACKETKGRLNSQPLSRRIKNHKDNLYKNLHLL